MSRVDRAGAVLFAMLAVLYGTGCGEGETKTHTKKPLYTAQDSIGGCLLKGGAQRADDDDDLEFLQQAESNDEVAKILFALDRRAQLFVNAWTAVPREGRPPSWIVWFAQPFDKELSPMEIVQSLDSEGYVMFLVDPTKEERRGTERCIQIGAGKGAMQHPLG